MRQGGRLLLVAMMQAAYSRNPASAAHYVYGMLALQHWLVLFLDVHISVVCCSQVSV